MHTAWYGTAVGLTITTLSLVEFSPSSYLLAVSFAIAVLGVPHGGLDHWAGRRMLMPYWGQSWPVVFGLIYLAVSLAVVAGWSYAPFVTVMAFFLLSAWHFGREDQQFGRSDSAVVAGWEKSEVWQHLLAVCLGGVAIWGVVLFRPSEVASLLELMLPTSLASQAGQIVEITRILAAVAMGIAVTYSMVSLVRGSSVRVAISTLITAVASATLPVLISFVLYFCGWHSVRGLIRLRAESGMVWSRFLLRVSPLSLAAIALIYCVNQVLVVPEAGTEIYSGGMSFQALLRMTFIGLSSIAVPHLLLHEVASARFDSRSAAGCCSMQLEARSTA